MKATGKIIGRLIVGCVFACCLTSNVYSQITQGASSAPLTAEQIAAQRAQALREMEDAMTQAMEQA